MMFAKRFIKSVIIFTAGMCLISEMAFSADACPNLSADIAQKNRRLVKGEEQLMMIPTHKCDAALRVFAPQGTCSKESLADCNTLELVLEDRQQAHLLGTLHQESRTGNSGGIFAPIAFTKDDQHIILRAYMGDPGAGGGSVNYGYEIIDRKKITDLQDLAAPDAVFYDDFGKVIYTKNSDKLPSFYRPGPKADSNGAIIAVGDLTAMQEKEILEEPDTTFDILDVDEKAHTVKIMATKHVFTAKCPREDEEALGCSEKSTQDRIIPLP